MKARVANYVWIGGGIGFGMFIMTMLLSAGFNVRWKWLGIFSYPPLWIMMRCGVTHSMPWIFYFVPIGLLWNAVIGAILGFGVHACMRGRQRGQADK
jgi:hypothetical protein